MFAFLIVNGGPFGIVPALRIDVSFRTQSCGRGCHSERVMGINGTLWQGRSGASHASAVERRDDLGSLSLSARQQSSCYQSGKPTTGDMCKSFGTHCDARFAVRERIAGDDGLPAIVDPKRCWATSSPGWPATCSPSISERHGERKMGARVDKIKKKFERDRNGFTAPNLSNTSIPTSACLTSRARKCRRPAISESSDR